MLFFLAKMAEWNCKRQCRGKPFRLSCGTLIVRENNYSLFDSGSSLWDLHNRGGWLPQKVTPKTDTDSVARSYHRANAKSDVHHVLVCFASMLDCLFDKVFEILIINWAFIYLMIAYPRRHLMSVRVSIISNAVWTMFTMHPHYK